MKVLITGNMGYIGPTIADQIKSAYPGAEIIGVDEGFFAHCLTGATTLPETRIDQQIFSDVRSLDASVLQGCDAVVHLAAVSNDPMGKTFEKVTDEINCQSSIRLAEMAKAAGVKNYVFASSCSVYGFAEGGPRCEEDELNPLTAYARSKIATEKGTEPLADDNFVVTCLRFATACGMSERTRLDLVLNDFVAGAVSTGEITILSDGTPWRPLIHIKDMARAIDWGCSRKAENGGAFLAINAGSDEWNYQVKDLAAAVADVVPNTKVSINPDAVPDKRSYQVSFEKFRKLAPNHQPQVSLKQAVEGLKEGLEAMNFDNANFRDSNYMRLKVLNGHLDAKRIDDELHWIRKV
ncbi:MAG: SDR family oxidoreductase [Gammaproteobacteria bacterium]|nr:SDR family oxidoreductase [Gammaproteobacteria bacterium]